MTYMDEVRARLNPGGHNLIDVIAGDAQIRRGQLKVFGGRLGWTWVMCWLALGASGTGSAVLVWAAVRILSR